MVDHEVVIDDGVSTTDSVKVKTDDRCDVIVPADKWPFIRKCQNPQTWHITGGLDIEELDDVRLVCDEHKRELVMSGLQVNIEEYSPDVDSD